MITIKGMDVNKRESCDNCNRIMPVLKYRFFDKNNKKPYVTLTLCEDCCGSMSNLFYTSVKDNKDYIYNNDEITEEK